MARHAGVVLPLFSAPSSRSWGIGELRDLEALSAWLGAAGFDRLMLLPLGTMAPLDTSPYSAASAMAIDPIFIAIDGLEDFERAGGDRALSSEALRARDEARACDAVAYRLVRRAKDEALDLAFASFLRDEWRVMTARAAACAGFIARERWWLDDYALFGAIAGVTHTANWQAWPPALAAREPRALDEARRQLASDILRHQYLQWIAAEQWQAARRAARAREVLVVGDAPFGVATDSADVWARSGEFLLEASAGVPPDAFSPTGQDWGLPMYRWEVIAAGGFAWMRDRVRRMAALYDSVRIDHLVGFYRSYGRIGTGEGFFVPPDEPTQTRQGEQVLRIAIEAGIEVLAEDLGTVPDFVRASMARLGVPGLKVLRWERDYHAASQPFLDPATFSPVSVAMTGTHDTETMAAWWDEAPIEERRAFAAIPSLGGSLDPSAPWSDRIRDLMLDVAYHAGSDQLFVPVQDVFGWRDRINTPATITPLNWTWRLPWASDALTSEPEAVERARACRQLAAATGRLAATASE